MRRLKRTALVLVLLAAAACACVVALRVWTHAGSAGRIYRRVADVPSSDEPRVAVVFGAGLWPDGRPSPVLYDRVATAVELYRAGKVRKLLLTGDNRFKHYSEPDVMLKTANEMGVPVEDLVADYAGRRTYDSCFRAREIFGVRRAVLVTQEFHLDRALYLCGALGVESVGVVADRRTYPRGAHFWWSLREFPATLGAWGDLNLFRPSLVLGDKIPIKESTKRP